MKILKKFELRYQQQEEYRNKIYAFCYDYLDRKSEYELTPETLLNMGEYEIHELGFPEFLYNASDIIELPFDIVNLKFPYLEYYECGDPAPLSIMKLVDLLTEMMMIYQTQWEEFKALPQHEQDQYYTKLYSIIEKYLPLHDVTFSPDMFVNVGGYSVHGYRAKSMVRRCAFVMGLNKDRVYDVFDNEYYFKFPIEWRYAPIYIIWGIIFFILGMVCLIFYLILYSVKWMITRKWDFVIPPPKILTPMTANEFTDKIIGIWLVERFYQKHKSNDIKENK